MEGEERVNIGIVHSLLAVVCRARGSLVVEVRDRSIRTDSRGTLGGQITESARTHFRGKESCAKEDVLAGARKAHLRVGERRVLEHHGDTGNFNVRDKSVASGSRQRSVESQRKNGGILGMIVGSDVAKGRRRSRGGQPEPRGRRVGDGQRRQINSGKRRARAGAEANITREVWNTLDHSELAMCVGAQRTRKITHREVQVIETELRSIVKAVAGKRAREYLDRKGRQNGWTETVRTRRTRARAAVATQGGEVDDKKSKTKVERPEGVGRAAKGGRQQKPKKRRRMMRMSSEVRSHFGSSHFMFERAV